MARRTRWLAAVVVAVLPGCSAGEDLVDELSYEQPSPDGAADICGPPLHESLRSLDQLLGNVRFTAYDGEGRSYTEAVVVGRFADVRKGSGYVPPEPDGPSDLPVSYDDPDALYRSLHGVFAVEAVVSGEVPADEIQVRFQTRDDYLDRFADGLPGLGRVVLFLGRSRAADVVDDPSVYALVGHFLAPVADDGRLDLPLVPDHEATRLLRATPRLSDLERAAEEPVRTIRVDVCANPVG